MKITYNMASSLNIALHLRDIDKDYFEYLINRVCLNDYAEKIYRFAYCFEAWDSARLVGLVAAYLNIEEESGYITNVSVLPAWQSRGVASQLLLECINYLENAGIKEIGLEVAITSVRAQKLYLKHGFIFCGETIQSFEMVRYCR